MSYEYRVTWRREHDRRLRSRLYQTLTGAVVFASFIEDPPDATPGSVLADTVDPLGAPVEVRILRREVGEWAEVPA